MKVRATKLGYYGLILRRPGKVFVLKDTKHFSSRWMEKVAQKEKVEVMDEPMDRIAEEVAEAELNANDPL